MIQIAQEITSNLSITKDTIEISDLKILRIKNKTNFID